jgi:hypothetical protein
VQLGVWTTIEAIAARPYDGISRTVGRDVVGDELRKFVIRFLVNHFAFSQRDYNTSNRRRGPVRDESRCGSPKQKSNVRFFIRTLALE